MLTLLNVVSWNHICWCTLKRKHLSVLFVMLHVLSVVFWKRICWRTLVRNRLRVLFAMLKFSIGTLKTHMVKHTGEKPFRCICNPGFTTSCNLNRHKLMHTGEKPFKCNIWIASYTKRGQLITHMLTHTGVKAFGWFQLFNVKQFQNCG